MTFICTLAGEPLKDSGVTVFDASRIRKDILIGCEVERGLDRHFNLKRPTKVQQQYFLMRTNLSAGALA
jgi:hypothetical protein